MNLHTRVDALWDHLEKRQGSTLPPADDLILYHLDADALAGTLTEEDFESTKRDLLARSETAQARRNSKTPQKEPEQLWLFGDYELIIDACLDGDPDVKKRVAEADADGRRGLSTLKYHLQKAKAKPSGLAAHALRICELDQEYYESRLKDLRNITVLKSSEGEPKYELRMTIGGRRVKERFLTLTAAQNTRDIIKSRALHY